MQQSFTKKSNAVILKKIDHQSNRHHFCLRDTLRASLCDINFNQPCSWIMIITSSFISLTLCLTSSILIFVYKNLLPTYLVSAPSPSLQYPQLWSYSNSSHTFWPQRKHFKPLITNKPNWLSFNVKRYIKLTLPWIKRCAIKL